MVKGPLWPDLVERNVPGWRTQAGLLPRRRPPRVARRVAPDAVRRWLSATGTTSASTTSTRMGGAFQAGRGFPGCTPERSDDGGRGGCRVRRGTTDETGPATFRRRVVLPSPGHDLAATVDGLLNAAAAPDAGSARLAALVVPHAGYGCSGSVAASAYRQGLGRSRVTFGRSADRLR
jgi:hypothetical protein